MDRAKANGPCTDAYTYPLAPHLTMPSPLAPHSQNTPASHGKAPRKQTNPRKNYKPAGLAEKGYDRSTRQLVVEAGSLDLGTLGLGKTSALPHEGADGHTTLAPLVTLPGKREVLLKLLGVPIVVDPELKFEKMFVSVKLDGNLADMAFVEELTRSADKPDEYPQFIPAEFRNATFTVKTPVWGTDSVMLRVKIQPHAKITDTDKSLLAFSDLSKGDTVDLVVKPNAWFRPAAGDENGIETGWSFSATQLRRRERAGAGLGGEEEMDYLD